MGRKCSVFKCQSGYQYVSRKRKAELENLNHETVVQKTESVKTYSFPEDKEECASWLRALPNSNLTYEEVQKSLKTDALRNASALSTGPQESQLN